MQKGHPQVAFLHCFLSERSRALRALRGGFEGLGVLAQHSSNRLTAVALGRQRRAPRARDACTPAN